MTPQEGERARRWRERRGWTPKKLSQLTGYATPTIWWMEKGQTPPRNGNEQGTLRKQVWLRYKNVCAGVDANNRGKKFNW